MLYIIKQIHLCGAIFSWNLNNKHYEKFYIEWSSPLLNMNSIIIIDQKFGKSLIFLSSFIQNT